MARFLSLLFSLLLIMSNILLIIPSPAMATSQQLCHAPSFSSFFAFGDSTTDTGNAVRGGATPDHIRHSPATRLPYGQTFFNAPTGRFSDGRLMVDVLAQVLKLPFLPPHLELSSSAGKSQNYAVAGATALDVPTVQWLAGVTPTTSNSLSVQLGWFKADTNGVDLREALVYFGEVGGNEYYYALSSNRSPEDVAVSIVPKVAKKVADSLEELLSSGVQNLVIQGQYPMGCLPIYLHKYSDLPRDQHGCVEAVSAVSNTHDQLLKAAIATAASNHPDANIVFFDTTAAYLHILDYAAAYGFTDVKRACYALGGLGLGLNAGHDHAAADPCPNPQNYISWDGIHLTDAMNFDLVKLFLTNSIFASPFPNFISAAVSGSSCL